MIVANARLLQQRRTGQPRYFEEVRRRLTVPLASVAPTRRLRSAHGHAWEQTVLAAKARRDLLWSPGNSGPLALARQVVTIHDVSMLDHPEWFSREFAAWYAFLVPRLAKRARHLMTDSEFSKARIVELCGVPPDKVTVTPLGVDNAIVQSSESARSAVRTTFGLDRPYVLTLGSVQPRKNLRRLIEAWTALGDRTRDMLLVVGGGTFSSVFASADLPDLPANVRLIGYVAEELIGALYAGAEFFCYPSLYEGFGMPPLEAMAAGVPVLTSNSTSLPEVVGDAAVLVDPLDVASIADGISRLISDDRLREELARRGTNRATKFSWEDTAAVVDRVLISNNEMS